MRRFIVLLALALTLMVLLPGTSPADKPLRGQMELDFYPVNPIWRGTITGDISGNIFFTNVGTGKRGNQEPGMVIPFAEIWLITDEYGNMLLTGTDEGVVSPNSEYQVHPRVLLLDGFQNRFLYEAIHGFDFRKLRSSA